MIRPRSGANVILLCGAIFAGVGAVILAAGISMAVNMDYVMAHGQGDVRFLPVIFILMGGIFTVLGVTLLVFCAQKRAMKRRLIQQGDCVYAEITAIPMDYSVRVNGWPTYRIECSWQDPRTIILHIFRSENLLIDPACCVTQTTVRVYVDRNSDFRHYYVDTDSVLPEIRQH